MFSQSNLEKIKKIIKEFFSKTTFSVEIILLSQKDKTLSIDLGTDSPQVLIGDDGQTLNEIQHLLKLILRKKIVVENSPYLEGRVASEEASLIPKGREEFFYIDLDINDYKKKKDKYLKDIACLLADEVVLNKKEKVLPPMSARERRIVHLALTDRQDVITESIGQDTKRKVVIKLVRARLND